MGSLVPRPVVVRAAIVGVSPDDHVLELIEYPNVAGDVVPRDITTPGMTHFGVVCDDLVAERSRLEALGVSFLTPGIADVAGLRTTWLRDPLRTSGLGFWGATCLARCAALGLVTPGRDGGAMSLLIMCRYSC